MRIAVSEFTSLLKKATGASISVVTDDQAIINADSEYISLGYNALSEKFGLVRNELLGTDGYAIKIKNRSVFVLGENYGALYGVYALLNDLVGYEFYYKDEIKTDESDTVSFSMVQNRIFVPSFKNRAAGYGTMWAENDVINPNAYGVKIYTDYFASVNGAVFHTSFACVPPQSYGKAHPKWYNKGKDQLCFTAQGDSAEYSALVAVVANALKVAADKSPEKQYVAFMGQDNASVCDCEQCKWYKGYYGSDSAALLLFVNDVYRTFEQLYKNEGKSVTTKICMLAYLGYYEAPSKHTEELGLLSGVAVVVAPIEIEYDKPFDEDTKNNFSGWKKLCGTLGAWLYDCAYGVSGSGADCTFVPFDSFSGMKERYAFLHSLGTEFVFTEGQSGCFGLQSGFNNLKMYLNSRLMNDINSETEELTKEFFQEFYKDGAEDMFSLFSAFATHADEMRRSGASATPYGSWGNAEYWNKSFLLGLKEKISAALSRVEKYKSEDAALYEKLYKRIVAERIDVDYLLIKFYGNQTDKETLLSELKSDVIAIGFQIGGLYGENLFNSLF